DDVRECRDPAQFRRGCAQPDGKNCQEAAGCGQCQPKPGNFENQMMEIGTFDVGTVFHIPLWAQPLYKQHGSHGCDPVFSMVCCFRVYATSALCNLEKCITSCFSFL